MDVDLKNLDRDFFVANETEYAKHFLEVKNWHTVPILNYCPLHLLKDGALVRFRGIIQDMLESETYLEKYEVINDETKETRLQIGKYQDILSLKPNESFNLEGSANEYADRRLFHIVALPYLNPWAFEIETKFKNVPQSSVGKGNQLNKRTMEVEDSGENSDSSVDSHENSKRLCLNNNQETNSSAAGNSQYSNNINLPRKVGFNTSCVAKLYTGHKSYLLNSYVEILGFLSIDGAQFNSQVKSIPPDNEMDIEGMSSMPYNAPQLHITAVRNLTNLNPLLDIGLADIDRSFTSKVQSSLSSLQSILTQCLFGDKLAAQYLIGNLISTVYAREEQTLGQFSVNIFNIPSDESLADYTKSLYDVLEMLLPASQYLSMTLENMNSVPFVPKKNYVTNQLESGILQLADHTHLTLDETKLKAGKLEENGVHGVKHLSDIILNQFIYYDFQYYKLGFQTNVSVLVLSEGSSMLPSNCRIPLKYDADTVPLIMETLKAAKHYIQPKLNELRQYLTNCKVVDFNILPSMSQVIEHDFVEMRKIDQRIGTEFLHNLLILSRLMGLATGKNQLDEETWQMAKDMEVERRSRLNVI